MEREGNSELRVRNSELVVAVGLYCGLGFGGYGVRFGRGVIWLVVVGVAAGVLGWAEEPPVGMPSEEAWRDLGSTDARAAQWAASSLKFQFDEGQDFIVAKLTAAPDATEVAVLIVQLDDEQFKLREAASKRLLELGRAVEKSLQEALAGAKSEELKVRLQGLVDRLQKMERPEAEEDQRQMLGLRLLEGAAANLRKVAAKATWESTRRAAKKIVDQLDRKSWEELIAQAARKAASGEKIAERMAQLTSQLRAAGVEIDASLRAQIERLPAVEKAAVTRKVLEAKLAADPMDAPVREALVTVLLVDLDDAAAAAKVAQGAAIEESLRGAAGWAAKPVTALTFTEKEELAKFYIVAAKTSGPAGKWPALDHAGMLLALCLSDRTVDEAGRTRLGNEMAAVQAELGRIAAAGR